MSNTPALNAARTPRMEMRLEMRQDPVESYCLNLHEKYAPDWSVWECARELFSNARDASPDDLRITSPDANTLEIFTPTAPDLAELFIIGCGSKQPGGDTIGQFGEGLKLTALAATRKPGGSLTIRLPEQAITFALREHFGQNVLFADVEATEAADGCLCTLVMEGAGYALNGKVIEGKESHLIPKDPASDPQVFCKGIWICSLDKKDTLFSYNLNGLELNRDRSHVDPWSIKYEIGALLLAQMADVAPRLVKSPTSWEADECLNSVAWNATDAQKDALANAMRDLYGPRVVMATHGEALLKATQAGYKPVSCGAGLTDLLQGRVPTDESIFPKMSVGLKERAVRAEWKEGLAELHRLAELVDMDVRIKVFADHISDLLGKAETNAQLVWLNERLFHADNRFERVRTFIHELAHLQSHGGDETRTFENGLDLIGGKLALQLLEVKP